MLGKQIVFKDEAATDSGTTNEIGHEYIYAVNGSSVTIGSDATESVHVGTGLQSERQILQSRASILFLVQKTSIIIINGVERPPSVALGQVL